MSTQKQIEANRLNAQESTGPKTRGGKFISSQNAITHGLFANSLLLPDESEDCFNALMASYINHFNPTTPDEFGLVETMAANRWRLRRTWTLETVSLTQEQEAQSAATRGEDPPFKTVLANRNLTNPPRSLESLSRHEVRCDRQYHRAAERLRVFQLRAEMSEKKETPKGSQQPAQNQQLNHFREPDRTIDEPSTKPDQSLNEA